MRSFLSLTVAMLFATSAGADVKLSDKAFRQLTDTIQEQSERIRQLETLLDGERQSCRQTVENYERCRRRCGSDGHGPETPSGDP